MSLASALALLALAGEPLAWAPVPRPVIGVMVEEASGAQQIVSRSALMSGAARAFEGFRVRPVELDVAEVSRCGASLRCRAALAASAGASLMVVLYLENDADEARVDVDVLDVARVATSTASSSFELERASRVPLAGRGAQVLRSGDDATSVLAAWLAARLEPALIQRGMRLNEARVRVLGLPAGARVFDGTGARQDVPADGLVLVDLPPSPVTLRMEADDYAPSIVSIAPGVTEVDVSLEATPLRWARRGVFVAGLASAAVGVAGMVVGAARAAGEPAAGCLRLAAERCGPAFAGANGVDGGSAWVPTSAALVGLGLGVAAEGWARGEPEAGLWGGLGGLVLGGVVFAVLLGAGGGS